MTTPTPAGWYDGARACQLAAVAQFVKLWPYRADQESDWTPDLLGDCQRKAAWARDRLLEAGWPQDCMILYACTLPDGRRHALLTVTIALSHGIREIALDSMIGEPRAKDQLTGYTKWTRAEA